MAAYSKQDVRSGMPQNVNLDTYDADAMMADLGPQRLKDLPLRGRVVHQSNAGPSKNGSIQNEAIAKWSQFLEKEAEELGKKVGDDVGEDGLGLGGSYRKGPNYRPAPINTVPKAASRVPEPARFRAGARGPMSGNLRRPVSPPRDSFLGPRPTNPIPRIVRLRGQIVTRHVNTKALSRSTTTSSSQASSTNQSHSSRPEPTVALGLAAINLKGANLKPDLNTPPNAPKNSRQNSTNISTINTPIVGSHVFESQEQGKATRSQSLASHSLVDTISSTLSTTPSRSGSRLSSVHQTPINSALLAIRTHKKESRTRTRYTIRPPPEAAKNHWNLGSQTEVTQPKSGVFAVISDTIKPQDEQITSPANASIKLNAQSLHTAQPEVPAIAEAIEPPKSQVQPSSNQSFQGLSGSKYASPDPPSGLMSSKYALPSGLMSSKYASPAPPSGLMGSKYATPAVTELSSSGYAVPNTSGLFDTNHRNFDISGSSSSKYAPGNKDTIPMASGLSASKYAVSQSPRFFRPDAVSCLSSGTNASHQPRNPTSLEATHSSNQFIRVEALMDTGNENNMECTVEEKDSRVVETANAEPSDKIVVDQLAQNAKNEKQEPMQPPQRLLDSIAAKYKFATPKQISGLARRYGTLFIADKEFPKSVSPPDREIDEKSRAFKALFISRDRRVIRQPELPIIHKVSS